MATEETPTTLIEDVESTKAAIPTSPAKSAGSPSSSPKISVSRKPSHEKNDSDTPQLFPAPGEKVKLDLVRRSFLRAGFDFQYIPESAQKTKLRDWAKGLFWKLTDCKYDFREDSDDYDYSYENDFNTCNDGDGGYRISSIWAEVLRIEDVDESVSSPTWVFKAYQCGYRNCGTFGSTFGPFKLDHEFRVVDANDPAKTDIDFEYVCPYEDGNYTCRWCREKWHDPWCKDYDAYVGYHIGTL